MDDFVRGVHAAVLPLKISGCCGVMYQAETDFGRRGSEQAEKAASALDRAALELHGKESVVASAAAAKLHAASHLVLQVLNQ